MNHSATPWRAPILAEIESCALTIAPHVIETPVLQWSSDTVTHYLGSHAEVFLKMELLQHSGSFKARAAIYNVLQLSAQQARMGITTVSAGNHAVATAYAANRLGTSAKVVMLESTNSARLAAARGYGAELVIAKDSVSGFQRVEEIVDTEGRVNIHAFEGFNVTCATATCGLELLRAVPQLDAVVVPIGGGGLCSGIALAVKTINPDCRVYGVEPRGAALMSASFRAGRPLSLAGQHSIADSLLPPMTLPYAYTMCRRFVDEIVLVEDEAIAAAAALLFAQRKLVVEAAAAVSCAAAFGPLRTKLRNRRVALIVCGANIDIEGFSRLIKAGEQALANGALPWQAGS